ncbi:sensor domain-containing protein [Nonomuraea angiospora]|uniref:histidine kinase n=1 Tax=Nonomuraea angiospora TaxID=46172 RepID=A0ABR9M9P1_9ACTN|nr:sensor domain-containing protein [Nonomuraea angiospora]MBE1589315.1 signal transduction histidine kinase [Nonomuraea angiospora]
MRTYAIAPVRCLALAGLAALGWPLLAAVFVGSHLGLPSPAFFVEQARRLPALARRLAGRWGGLEISPPYRPAPPPPRRDADGWYRDGDDLFRSAFLPGYVMKMRWIFRDPATWRDLYWMAVNPVVGGLPVVVPPALTAGGIAMIWLRHPVLGGAAVLLGIAMGPVMVRFHARWSRVLLAPAPREGRGGSAAVLVPRLVAGARLCASVGLAVAAAAPALAHVAAIVVTAMRLWPDAVLAARRFVSWRRTLIGDWTGVRIVSPYLDEPPMPAPNPDGSYRTGWGEFGTVHRRRESAVRAQRWRWTVRDPASWRDLAWLSLEVPVAAMLYAVPAALIIGGFVACCWLWVWIKALGLVGASIGWSPDDTLWAAVPALAGLPAPVAGLVAAALGIAVAPALLRCHARLSRSLLGPTRTAVLTRRVGALASSRTRISDAQAAELRRIERDLHDGAQARWIAVGMQLGAVEQLISADPEAAKAMIARAKDVSVTALAELRELIRGIYPPVLADRGLADAVRTLALDAPLEAEVLVDMAGQVPPPIEAAVYFAVSELLTNVAKHAAASKVSVELRHEGGLLTTTVTDDGLGGATAGRGGGLHGIRRRLDGFDGVLVISSPPGGPTVATLEIPCALSSPRTSTFSEKGSRTF